MFKADRQIALVIFAVRCGVALFKSEFKNEQLSIYKVYLRSKFEFKVYTVQYFSNYEKTKLIIQSKPFFNHLFAQVPQASRVGLARRVLFERHRFTVSKVEATRWPQTWLDCAVYARL